MQHFSTDIGFAHRLDEEDSLAHFRQRFLIDDPDLIYLDGNSLGRLPLSTAGRMRHLVEKEWGRSLIRGWGESWIMSPERVGGKIAHLIGARPDEVIVADSTSVNLFKLVAAALKVRPERHKIVTDDLNFPSDLYILQGACALAGHSHRVQVLRSPDGIHGPLEAISEAIDENTALVALSHTVFKSGFTYDMAAVTRLAHQQGAMMLWDLSHSAGAVPIKLNEAGVDLAVGCTYKYLNGGPGSPAYLYVKKEWQEQLGNPLSGWMGQKDPFNFDLDYRPAAGLRRFLTGTPPILSLSAIEPGIDILLEAGIEEVRAKSIRQSEYLIAMWEGRLAPLGYRLNSPRDPYQRGSHVSLGHDEGLRIDQALIKEMNVLPDFRYPDNIRLGIAPLYNSFEEIHRAVDCLHRVISEGIFEKYDLEGLSVT